MKIVKNWIFTHKCFNFLSLLFIFPFPLQKAVARVSHIFLLPLRCARLCLPLRCSFLCLPLRCARLCLTLPCARLCLLGELKYKQKWIDLIAFIYLLMLVLCEILKMKIYEQKYFRSHLAKSKLFEYFRGRKLFW